MRDKTMTVLTTAMRRALACVFAVALVLCCLPLVAAPSAGATELTEVSGSGTASDPWLIGAESQDDVQAYVSGTTLHITGEGDMADLVKSGLSCAPWYTDTSLRSSITTLSFSVGVTSIGAQAFRAMTALTTVDLRDTRIKSIGSMAFYGCSSLKTLYVPAAVSSIGGSAFYECSSLSKVYFFHTTSSTIQIAANAFHSENSITTTVFIPWLTKRVNTTLRYYDWSESNSDNPSQRSVKYSNYYDEDEDSFPDNANTSRYYYYYVNTASEVGLMTGYASGKFGVGDGLTRAQMAVIMWRIAEPVAAASYDQSTAKDTTGKSDLADGKYYTASVNWAVENGVMDGYENGSFGPNDTITFQQFCKVLANYLSDGQADSWSTSSLSGFSDGSKVKSWARTAVAWCVDKGLVSGYSNGTLKPAEDVQRGRAATVLVQAYEAKLLEL